MTFVNAGTAGVGSLRIVGTRIAAVNGAAAAGDTRGRSGWRAAAAGLINAHDHLQLNTLPPLESRGATNRAHEWILDVDACGGRTRFEALVAVPRNDRLLIGGVKNLLSGVTTVAHHDPLYPFLSDPCFPTRVVTNCGWSHSLYIDGDEQVRDSCGRTPPDHPWIIHAAEGTDDESADGI